MSTDTRKTVLLGDLIVAAFDIAARHSTDPREVSRLATKAVAAVLRRTQEGSRPPKRNRSMRRSFLWATARSPRAANFRRSRSKSAPRCSAASYSGSEVKRDGKDHIILHEDNTLGILEH